MRYIFFFFFFTFRLFIYIPATPRGRCLLIPRILLLLLHLDFVHHFWNGFLFFLGTFSHHIIRKVHDLLDRFQIILFIWLVTLVRRITIIKINLVSILLRCLFQWLLLTFLLLYELLALESRLLYLSWNNRLFFLLRWCTNPWINHLLFFGRSTDLARLPWRNPGISKIFFLYRRISHRLNNRFFYYLFKGALRFLDQLFFYLCLEELLLAFSWLFLGIFKLQLRILFANWLRSNT